MRLFFARRFSLEIGLFALVVLLHLYPLFVPANSLMEWFPSDDAFYYFKTAQNIADGHGITFDGIGRDSGFHPLWMAVITPLFALARFDLILPLRLVVLLSALLNAGTAVVIYQLARRSNLIAAAAVFAALFWAFYPSIHTNVIELGLESILSAFLIILLLSRVVREEISTPRQTLVTGIIALLTVLARLDNIFLVAALGAWLAFRPNRQDLTRVRYLLLADALLIEFGVLWSYMVRVGFGPQYAQAATSAYFMLLGALALRVALYYALGLYGRSGGSPRGLAIYLLRAAAASLLVSGLLAGLMLALQAAHVFPGFPRLALVYEAGFSLAAVLLTRLVMALIDRRRHATPQDLPGHLYPALNWRETLTRLVIYFAPLVVGLVIYMAASQWYFGTPMPVSGQIKRWWGTLPNVIYGSPVNNVTGLLGIFIKGSPWGLVENLLGKPPFLPPAARLGFYGLIILALLFWQRQRMAHGAHGLGLYPLMAGSLAQLFSYTGTGYLHMRSWYWTAEMLAITLALGLLLDAALCSLQRFNAPLAKRGLPGWARIEALAFLLCAVVIVQSEADMIHRMPLTVEPRKAERYLASIRELESMTEPGSRIGSTGGGVIAYFIEGRTIVNLDGLMNTAEYYHMLQAGTAREYLDRIGLDYIYTSAYPITSSDPYFQFKGRLRRIKDFGGSTLFSWVH